MDFTFHTTVILSLIIVCVFLCVMASIGGRIREREEREKRQGGVLTESAKPTPLRPTPLPDPPVETDRGTGGIYEPRLGNTRGLPKGRPAYGEIGPVEPEHKELGGNAR